MNTTIKELEVVYLDTRRANIMFNAQLQELLPRQLLHINVLHLSQFSYFYIKSSAANAQLMLNQVHVATPAASSRHSLQFAKLQRIYSYKQTNDQIFLRLHPESLTMKAEGLAKRKSSGQCQAAD